MLLEAGRDRDIRLSIAQSMPTQINPNVDTEILASKANAEVIVKKNLLVRMYFSIVFSSIQLSGIVERN